MSDPATDLEAVQRWMQSALMEAGGDEERQQAARLFAPSRRLSGPERLAIYQRGYRARLLECMKAQFKALCHALGEELFADFAIEYLRAYPSRSHTLAELGARFSDYLDETRPDRDSPPEERAAWADFMVDLARFEWDVYTRFNAAGHEGQPYADASVADARLRLQPCFSLGQYRFPVHVYYRQVRDGEDPELPDSAATWIALVRKDYLTGVFALRPPQVAFLKALSAGMAVADALSSVATAMAATEQEASEAWARWRGGWIAAGFFVEAGV